MKAKVDYFEGGALIDIKTTSQFDNLRSQIFKYHYDISLVHYKEGLEANGEQVNQMGWLFIESEYPFRTAFKAMPQWMEDAARDKLFLCYYRIAEGIINRKWEANNDKFDEQPFWHAQEADGITTFFDYGQPDGDGYSDPPVGPFCGG